MLFIVVFLQMDVLTYIHSYIKEALFLFAYGLLKIEGFLQMSTIKTNCHSRLTSELQHSL